MLHRLLLGLALLTIATAVRAQDAGAVTLAGVQLTRTLDAAGLQLELASCGVRDTLWIDHYVAALYLPRGASLQAARDPARAKAVLMVIVESRYLPAGIPEKWRLALDRELALEPMSRVRRAYRNLSDGDVVTILYLPEGGVSMLVNGRSVVFDPGHAVIDSILESWAGADPLSGKLRRLSLRHPC